MEGTDLSLKTIAGLYQQQIEKMTRRTNDNNQN